MMATRRCDQGCGRPAVTIDPTDDLGFCNAHHYLFLSLLLDHERRESLVAAPVKEPTMARHRRPRVMCVSMPHEGPAVHTERGTCCGACGLVITPCVGIPTAEVRFAARG